MKALSMLALVLCLNLLLIRLDAAPQRAPVFTGATSSTPVWLETLRTRANEKIGLIPEKMPGAKKDTPAKVDLGRKLYFDPILSINRSISCNSCHELNDQKGGADDEPTSPGALGQRGARNSPTVLNAGFQLAQFWDGRAATLEDQAKSPVLNPIEMAMPNEAAVQRRLEESPQYFWLFRKAFPKSSDPITFDHAAQAIAAFERTLITHDRFDDFLKGGDRALSAAELAGLNIFLTQGCATCHNGPTMGGRSYQKIGRINACEEASDPGRFAVTKDENDKLSFKVPVLRNIALTAPYFHHGKVASLGEAVSKMAWMQLGKTLSDAELKSLVLFLQSLTDKSRDVRVTEIAVTRQ
jgi:cytochrome c peroxidase